MMQLLKTMVIFLSFIEFVILKPTTEEDTLLEEVEIQSGLWGSNNIPKVDITIVVIDRVTNHIHDGTLFTQVEYMKLDSTWNHLK